MVEENDYKNVHIVFEGPDGVGKTTLALKLGDYLRTRYKDKLTVVNIAEPFRNEYFLKAIEGTPKEDGDTLLKLFMEQRFWGYREILDPLLNAEKTVVIQDRAYHSTCVYQGPVVSNRNPTQIYEMYASLLRKPTVTFIMMAPIIIRESRLKREFNRPEKGFFKDVEKRVFQEMVVAGYQDIIDSRLTEEAFNECWMLDASEIPDCLLTDVCDVVIPLIENKADCLESLFQF